MLSLLAALGSNSGGAAHSPRELAESFSVSSRGCKSITVATQPLPRVHLKQAASYSGISKLVKGDSAPEVTLPTVEVDTMVLPAQPLYSGFGSAIPLVPFAKDRSRANSRLALDLEEKRRSNPQTFSDEQSSDNEQIILVDKFTDDDDLSGQGGLKQGLIGRPASPILDSLGSSGSRDKQFRPGIESPPRSNSGFSARVMKLNIRNLPSTSSIGSPAITPSQISSRQRASVSERLPLLQPLSRPLSSASRTGNSPFIVPQGSRDFDRHPSSRNSPKENHDILPTVDEGLIRVRAWLYGSCLKAHRGPVVEGVVYQCTTRPLGGGRPWGLPSFVCTSVPQGLCS